MITRKNVATALFGALGFVCVIPCLFVASAGSASMAKLLGVDLSVPLAGLMLAFLIPSVLTLLTFIVAAKLTRSELTKYSFLGACIGAAVSSANAFFAVIIVIFTKQ